MSLGSFESVEQKAEYYLGRIDEKDGKEGFNSFLYINQNLVEQAKELDKKKKSGKKTGKLFGCIIAVKSNINVIDFPVSCASKALEEYNGSYNATVIERVLEEDGLIIGMTNMDEFACGSSGELSAFGATKNPASIERITGGSSSGSAAAVAAGFCDVALGSDTGGSIRNPASNCGVVGVKPSYGLVSRYGLVDLSMSLDQIGPLARNVRDADKVLDVIKGKDESDTTTLDFFEGKIKEKKKYKIGVVKVKGVDSRISEIVNKKVEDIREKNGWSLEEIQIEHIDLAVQTYYPIVYVEFFSGTRRFDGRKYGKKIEDFCGEEVLRRILGGSEISKSEVKGQYYDKALKIKRVIRKEFEKALSKVDCIVMPTVPKLPWKLGEGRDMATEDIYAFDALTNPVNLAEACAVSIPIGGVEEGKEKIPVGMQVICGKGEDEKMLKIAELIED